MLTKFFAHHAGRAARAVWKTVMSVKGEVKNIDGKRVATPEYRSWQMMKNRCLNSAACDYQYYGGRGIRIIKRWLQFENFLSDMGRKPALVLTLERKNVNGNYCKRNCIWAPRYVQSRNRTDSRFTEKQVIAVRRLYATGLYRQKDIAAMYSSTQAAISQIVRNAAWATRNGGAQ